MVSERIVSLLCCSQLLLALSACGQSSSSSNTVDWNNINYAEIVCGGESGSTYTGCSSKADENSINNPSKGGKR